MISKLWRELGAVLSDVLLMPFAYFRAWRSEWLADNGSYHLDWCEVFDSASRYSVNMKGRFV